MHGGLGQSGVVRCRKRPDVAWWAGQVLAERLALSVGNTGHGEMLAAYPGLVGQGLDWPRVVKEGVGIGDRAGEPELISDLRLSITIVVDVDLVEHFVAELVEVRSSVRTLEWNIVGDDRHGVRVVGADEGVEIRAVGDGILGDLGCFTVRGHGFTS